MLTCFDSQPASEAARTADSISQGSKFGKNSKKRKINAESDNDEEINAQVAAPVSKRSRQEEPPTKNNTSYTTPKKLRKFFKRLGYRDAEMAVLGRLVQGGATGPFLLTMRGMVENGIALRLQTLNNLLETDSGDMGRTKFTPAELELLAYKIAGATESDWAILSDGE